MYTDINFKSKKAMRDAIANGSKLSVFQPGGMYESKTDGDVSIEGPHYPEPHRWYARVRIANSIIVKVLS